MPYWYVITDEGRGRYGELSVLGQSEGLSTSQEWERGLLGQMLDRGEVSGEDLLEGTGLDAGRLLDRLETMSRRGYVQQLSG